MLSEDYSNRRHLREACYSLLTIAIGLLSCLIIAILTYYTYQSTAGNISYCSLWTDIPGRLALFLIFYYAAGICGALPIPRSIRVNWLPPPFILYRFESWRNLRDNLYLFFADNYRGYEALDIDPEMSPVRDECNGRDYDSSPTFHENSKNNPISETDTPKKCIDRSNRAARYKDVETASSATQKISPVRDECCGRDYDNSATFHVNSKNNQISKTDAPKQCIDRSNRAARYRDKEIGSSSKDWSLSFGSSISDCVFPTFQRESSKPPYLPDSSISSSEYVDAPSHELDKVTASLIDGYKAVAEFCDENNTPEVELSLPSYPRYPWSYLRNESGVPFEAKALHKNNLMAEQREIGECNKGRKVGENTSSTKNSENNLRADSYEFDPFTNPPLRISPIPDMIKTGSHDRAISVPVNIRKLGKRKTKSRKRIDSCSPPDRYQPNSATQISPESGDNSEANKEDKYCEKTTEIQTKVEHTQKDLIEFDQSFQARASTSRQSVDFPCDTSNSNMDGEASTSRQNIDVCPSESFSSNIDSEASASTQSTDVSPSSSPYRNVDVETSTSGQSIDNFPSNPSTSNTDGVVLTSRQNIEIFFNKSTDNNVDAEASTSRKNTDAFSSEISDTTDETSTSKQNIDVLPRKFSVSDSEQ